MFIQTEGFVLMLVQEFIGKLEKVEYPMVHKTVNTRLISALLEMGQVQGLLFHAKSKMRMSSQDNKNCRKEKPQQMNFLEQRLLLLAQLGANRSHTQHYCNS